MKTTTNRKLKPWKPKLYMNNTIFLNAVRFVLLLLTQVLLCNTFNFLGFINPMIYVLFFYWYPTQGNHTLFMVIAFLLGFTIDVFSDTLALHAFAALTVAYTRPTVMRLCFGSNYEFQNLSFKTTTRLQRTAFLGSLVVLHHSVFFALEFLSTSHFFLILKKIVATSIVTWVLCLLFTILFSPKRSNI